MSETPAAPAATPATENTLPAEPTPAPTIADIKAARRAAQKTTPPATPASNEPAKAVDDGGKPEAKTEPVQIDMDEKSLAQFTTLNKELRTARAKLKETEEKVAAYARYERAEALKKEGKHYDAAREAGFDVDAALHDLLGVQAQTPEATELTKLQKEVEDLKKARTDEQKAKDEQTKKSEAAEYERGHQRVIDHVTKEAAKYAYLSKDPDLVRAALKDAETAYEQLKTELRKDDPNADLPDDEKNKLLFDALDVHEEKWASKFGPKKDVPGFDSSLRGNVSEKADAPPKSMTFEEVKAARRKAGGKRAYPPSGTSPY